MLSLIFSELRNIWNTKYEWLLSNFWNFTLDKFENPNVDDLFSINNNFGAAEVTKASISMEKVFSDNYSMSVAKPSSNAKHS